MNVDLKVKPDWMTDEEWEQELRSQRRFRQVCIQCVLNVVICIVSLILSMRVLLS